MHEHTFDRRSENNNHPTRCLECNQYAIPKLQSIPPQKVDLDKLCGFMNELASKVRTGVRHFVQDGQIHFERLGDNGKVLESGVL